MTDEEADDAQTFHPRGHAPEPRCRNHGRGECRCDDDGSGAWEIEEGVTMSRTYHPRPSRHLNVQALRRADRRQRKRVEPRRPRPAERAAEGRDRYWLAPGLEAVG